MSESATFDPQHNRGELDKIVVECRDNMLGIRARRRQLNEEAGGIRKRLKDAGVDNGVFMTNVRIFEMEEDVRANHMDQFRLCYEAMNSGGQMDWIKATDADETTEQLTESAAE